MKKTLLLFCFSLTVIIAHAQIFMFPIVRNSACGNSGGKIDLFVIGGSAPYTYSWSNGASTSTLTNLSAGSYKAYVSDAIGDTASLLVDVFNDTYIELSLAVLDNDVNTNFYYSCRTVCNGGYRVLDGELNGTPPYTFTQNAGTQVPLGGANGIEFLGHCTGDTVSISVTDAGGCAGVFTQQVFGPKRPEMRVLTVQPACNSAANGSVIFKIPEDNGIFSTNVDYEVYSTVTGFSQLVHLGGSTYATYGLESGNYSLNRTYASANRQCEDDTLEFYIPSVNDNCASLSGYVWEDANADCTYDTLEREIPNQVIRIMPGSAYAISDAKGYFKISLPYGNYTAEWLNPPATQSCPLVQQVPFTLSSVIPNLVSSFALAPNSTADLSVYVQPGSGAVNPSGTFSIGLTYLNVGSSQANGSVLRYYFNPASAFQSSSTPPDSVGNGVLVWNLGNVAPGTTAASLSVFFTLSAGATIGASWNSYATISSSTPETELNNNVTYFLQIIGSAFDSNKKSSFDAYGTKNSFVLVDIDNTIYYTINFQNTHADTAYFVSILDTLSAFLDLSTFQLVAASPSCQLSIDSNRIARFYFPQANLPASSVNEAGSRGFVSYKVDVPFNLAALGNHVLNRAQIYFDTYPAIETNLTDVFIDISVGVKQTEFSKNLVLYPNPAKENLSMHLSNYSELAGTVELRSVDGRLVFEQKVKEQEIKLSISQLSLGTYMFRFIALDGKQYNALFVKE